jgi:hypothetical protein
MTRHVCHRRHITQACDGSLPPQTHAVLLPPLSPLPSLLSPLSAPPDARTHARTHARTLVQASAKLGRGIEETFLQITRKMMQVRDASGGKPSRRTVGNAPILVVSLSPLLSLSLPLSFPLPPSHLSLSDSLCLSVCLYLSLSPLALSHPLLLSSTIHPRLISIATRIRLSACAREHTHILTRVAPLCVCERACRRLQTRTRVGVRGEAATLLRVAPARIRRTHAICPQPCLPRGSWG